MDTPPPIRIHSALCIGCASCVRTCPARILTMEDGRAAVSGARCLECAHCEAVCPTQAITVTSLDPDTARFTTFAGDPAWLPFGAADPAHLVRLMRSRRSCRRFKDLPVDPAALDDLIKAGISAPSGTNSQRWTFTILPNREAVLHLCRAVQEFFRALNRQAASPWLRRGLKLLGQGRLDAYYRGYYPLVQKSLDEWEQHGTDRLFHHAPAAILAGSLPGASCPAEDALLATQNMLLAAHAMGFGTCLIGFAVAAMARDPRVKQAVGIPEGETIHSVIAIGHPDESYLRTAGRKRPLVRRFTP